MKSGSKLLGLALALATFLGATSAEAAVQANKAIVRAVRGTASFSADKGSSWQKLNVGRTLGQNSIVRTAAGSTVDLFLGDNGPVVRVTEDTQMGIDKLTSENTGVEKVIETQLDLKNGRILGNVKKLAAASKYEIKTPHGVAGIRGTQYDISANGRVTVIEGTVLVVYVVNGVALNPVLVSAGQTVVPPPAGQQPVVQQALPGQGQIIDVDIPVRDDVQVIAAAITEPNPNFETGSVTSEERAERIRDVIQTAIEQGITSPGQAIQLLKDAGINDSNAKKTVNEIVRDIIDAGKDIPKKDVTP